jgi:hypothetical protein
MTKKLNCEIREGMCTLRAQVLRLQTPGNRSDQQRPSLAVGSAAIAILQSRGYNVIGRAMLASGVVFLAG